jgi:hypothetical protein
MKHWLVVGLWACLATAGCSTVARGSQNKLAAATRPNIVERELPGLQEHAFGDSATGFVASTESTEVPTVTEAEGLVRVTIPLGTSEPVRCFVYSRPLNLAQTLRMFINHVAESVDHQGVDQVDAGEVGGVPYIAVHTSYLARPTEAENKPKQMGQLKYFAARGESSTTVCMHDEAGYNQTFERVVKRFVATQKFTEGQGDPAAKLMVWRDVSVARAGSTTVGVVEHRLYEGEAGYAYASSTSVLLPGEDGKVVASDEVDNQFSDTQGGIVEATYIKILNDSVAYNMGMHYEKGIGYHIDGVHNGAPIDLRLEASSALPDFASQTAVLRHLFADAKADTRAHWIGFSPEEPSKLVNVDFTKGATDATHKRGMLVANGKPSALELDNLGTPTEAKTDEITVHRVWLAKGDHR